jgi:hypothetical protein
MFWVVVSRAVLFIFVGRAWPWRGFRGLAYSVLNRIERGGSAQQERCALQLGKEPGVPVYQFMGNIGSVSLANRLGKHHGLRLVQFPQVLCKLVNCFYLFVGQFKFFQMVCSLQTPPVRLSSARRRQHKISITTAPPPPEKQRTQPTKPPEREPDEPCYSTMHPLTGTSE